MNASHKLPMYQAQHPYYDTALPRICSFLKEKQGYLTLIDVGANIGDSVSLVTEKVTGDFLCVEPDGKYFNFLLMNTRDIQSVVCENVLVSEVDGVSNVSLVEVSGTAYASNQHARGVESSCRVTTIDKLIEKHTLFSKANIIKVDTEGYDYKVIRGSSKLINESRPAIYFEVLPRRLTSIGENPLFIFDHLFQMGYSKALFYDNLGFPVVVINMCQLELISQLVNYASFKSGFYYDVLSLHDSMKNGFEFYQEEMKIFRKYKCPEASDGYL